MQGNKNAAGVNNVTTMLKGIPALGVAVNAIALAITYPLYEYFREVNGKSALSGLLFPVLWTVAVVLVQQLLQKSIFFPTGPASMTTATPGPTPNNLTTSSPQPPPLLDISKAPDAAGSNRSYAHKNNAQQAPVSGLHSAINSSSKAGAKLGPLKLSQEAKSFSPALRGTLSATTAPASFLREPKSFSTHRPHHRANLPFSIDTVPRQTILKAICSSRPRLESTTVEFAASVVKGMESPALHGEQLDAIASTNPKSANPLQSPCFFHQHFDDAINIQKVLDEISEDDLSHSRLVKTAAGVREVARQLARRTVKTAAKNVMIVTKARDNNLVMLTREITHWLMKTPRYGRDVGVNVYVDLKLKKSKRFDAAGMIEEDPRFAEMLKYWTPNLCWTHPEKFDLVLTLGGDGTVLFTSWLFQRIVPPILSFSLGSLGFLTNFQFESYKQHLNKVLDTGMRVNLKMRFTCTVYRDVDGEQKEAEQFEVLNELVIDRGPSPYVSQLELYGDDDLITVVQADGCIFSTPTGSTAYSLSAGGSLVHPDIPAILLTPICPHTLSFRPMIFNDSMQLRVCVPKDSRATAWCAFDGKGRLELRQGDMVTIAASQYPFPTVLSTSTEWIDAVSRTLRWNSRAAAQKAWDGDSAVGEDREPGEPEFDIDTDTGVYSDSCGEEGDDDTISPGGIQKRNMALFSS